MSHRPTDDEFTQSVAQPINIRRAFERAYAEARRARASEEAKDAQIVEKDAQIKALAEALLTTGEHHEELGGWHTDRCLLDGIGIGAPCTELCAQRRSALRLAGRIM